MPDHDQSLPVPQDDEPFVSPDITVSVEPDRRCRACGQTSVHVIAVTMRAGTEDRVIGGWAWCEACGACPHPVMEKPDA
ncbi:hypothetical protein ACIQZO_06145 [Streptomyces sp. NPDC097617]|uniref:hypothetical protein n=1 Tax=Streptomyces sp. NPDC097617 TaxID=3366091 RepID=UPI0037FCDACB